MNQFRIWMLCTGIAIGSTCVACSQASPPAGRAALDDGTTANAQQLLRAKETLRMHGAASPLRAGRPSTELDPLPFSRALTPPSMRTTSANRPPSSAHDPWNPSAPQLLAPFAPEVIANPRFVPVFYPRDPMQAQVEDFVRKLGGSSFWAHASEYGVGPATFAPSVVLDESPPSSLTRAEIRAFIQAKLDSSSSGFPARTPGDVYVVFFSADTTIADASGESCKQFDAYHDKVSPSSGDPAAFVAVPRCNGYLGATGIDSVTSAASRGLIAAVTNPFGVPYGPGYNEPDYEASGWALALTGKVHIDATDMCEFQPGVQRQDPALGYAVQRYYSNAAAAAFHDPCVPAPSRPYFNVLPITGATSGAEFQYGKGVSIPPGGQATIPLKLFSDTEAGEWQLSIREGGNRHVPPDPLHQLSFSFDVAHGRAGDVRHLTIKRSPAVPGTARASLPFAVVSKRGSTENVWWIVVGQ